ncbi:gliding motility-associated C-terminal domain-containing protein [Pedobacter kyonggii]|uniref:Gliding motility-associated C-terminal domain-containing protein n=1 Tax=Pedobacter kyonggii TaxID=1926871 RepID=A0A4Q9HFL7_9SPHI|nr:gliding motility-associated C-terminal domain-containing protein [Pedobacter kyonggii]TBO43859.1 gliding motility-associated C-terminal domain-containing protein [Pedobacter kyonggii]
MYKRIFYFFIFILFCQTAIAETFVVSSNNDSGPDSFREALTKSAANGNSEIDYIKFDIADISTAGRTIRILTDLPEVTSDLIIDASTQNGNTLSINDTKIVFDGVNFKHVTFTNQSFLKVNGVSVFELYGIIVKNFYYSFTGTASGPNTIYFKNANKNVKIGAVGKGNVFYNILGISGNFNDLNSKSSIQSFTIKNTIMGIEEDGVTIANKLQCISQIHRISNLIIGGNSKVEGNIIYGEFGSFIAIPGELIPAPFNMEIKNNIFYANKNEERPGITGNIGNRGNNFSIDANFNHPYPANITVTDNVFGISLGLLGFDNANILIARNSFGVSKDGTKSLPLFTQALSLNSINGRVLVGGTDISEGNIFANANDYKNYEKLFPGTLWAEKSNTVELSHNSFLCNPQIPYLIVNTGPYGKPIEALLDDVTATTIKGRSKSGAKIELFYADLECTNCQPKRYFASVLADGSGNWKYNGNIEAGYSILASATLNNVTSEFSDPRIYMLNAGPKIFKVTHQTCIEPNGKIEGVLTVNVNKIQWEDETGKVFGDKLDLINVPAGKYRIKANQFGCITHSEWVIVEDRSPQLAFGTVANLIHPSCGKLGSILNLFPFNYKEFFWLDENEKIIGKERELKDVPEGKYMLRIIGTDGCIKNFGPYILKNVVGPSADFSGAKPTNTSCKNKTGSIIGIIASSTGNITYKWTNEKNEVVGKDLDLLNIGEGTYILEVRDNSNCPAIVSDPIKINVVNGIIIDETSITKKASSCSANTGFIKGIKVTGATKYSWLNTASEEVSTTNELINAAPGTYLLKATNEFGCEAVSKSYIIEQAIPVKFSDFKIKTTDASCNLNNGTINLTLQGDVKPKAIKWKNSSGTIISTDTELNNLTAGTYAVYFTDENDCEIPYRSVEIKSISPLTLNQSEIEITPDDCGQKGGSIEKLIVAGGVPPYKFSWTNSLQKEISNSASLFQVESGTYELLITDQSNCGSISKSFYIQGNTQFIPPPIIEPITICGPTIINISVNNRGNSGFYNLYRNNETSPISSNSEGKFKVDINANSDYYITHSLFQCESAKTKLEIKINGSELVIPNSFSPNGDGINDLWVIPNINNYPQAIVRVYNRLGTMIFESIGQKQFDGKYKETILPIGTYYYTILLSDNCKQISGSLLILY